MLESVLLNALLISAQPQRQPFLYIDENAESAAVVATAVRFEPATGRASTATRLGTDGWGRARHELARAEGRSRFSLEFEPESGRLVWSVGADAPGVETLLPAATALAGPNLLRLELVNFDRGAALAVERLEIAVGGRRRELRGLGHGAMTRDLVTLFGPELAKGFRLTGELVMRGTPAAPGRLFVDFGLGRGRRVEVEIDGGGDVESVPPRVARVPGRKSAIGYFAPEESAALRAIGAGFREWGNGDALFSERTVDLAIGSVDSSWRARFEPTDPDLASGDSSDRAGASGSSTSPRPEGVIAFANAAAISVPSGQPGTSSGKASPYPSQIIVSGPVAGIVADTNVTLKDVTHSYPDDLDVLVVSPHGTAVLLLSDACGAGDLAAVDLKFDDQAPTSLTDDGPCVSGSYRPKEYDDGPDTFDAPAPAEPFDGLLSFFYQENGNGTWELFVFDDGAGDYGTIAGGWEIDFAPGPSTLVIPGSGSSGKASPYPYTQTVAANNSLFFGEVLDVDVLVGELWHQFPDDIDFLLVSPSGRKVSLVSDACGDVEIEKTTWTFDDEAADQLSDDATNCGAGPHRPASYSPVEDLSAPAPAGPYATTLAAFDGDNPVGTWSFYVEDDAGGDVGFVTPYVAIQLKTTGMFRDGFEGSPCVWNSTPEFPECDD